MHLRIDNNGVIYKEFTVYQVLHIYNFIEIISTTQQIDSISISIFR